MHHHAELLLPPYGAEELTENIERVMARFDENNGSNEEDWSYGHAFWDWYVLGGRFAGSKLLAQFDKVQMDKFQTWIQDEKITVSGLRAGKPTLSPSDQIDKVDAKWREMFPGTIPQCPLFDHANDKYGKDRESTIAGDVCTLGNVSPAMTCCRVIIAGPKGEDEPELETKFMISDSFWNGVNFVDSKWDKTVQSAVDLHCRRLEGYVPWYQKANDPKPDWLTVTIDYHS